MAYCMVLLNGCIVTSVEEVMHLSVISVRSCQKVVDEMFIIILRGVALREGIIH